MKRSVSVFCRLVITVTVCLTAGFFSSAPASNGKTIMGGEIIINGEVPLMEGAKVLKTMTYGPNTKVDLAVPATPEEVVNFYKQTMAAKGR